MFSFEKKIVTWLEQHLLILAIVFFTLLSIGVRYSMRSALSGDAQYCLIPWYQTIKGNGGLACLQSQTGDYNMLYQTIIALFTYLPIDPLFAYKILSITFDYLLAVALAYLVFINTNHNRFKSVVTYAIVIMLPTTCIDSALWAQCDSIFTFWSILSLIFFCKEKYAISFLFYGISFAFKLQAVFFLPFYLFVYVYKKQFSILYFLIIPCVMVVLSLGGIMHGRRISEVFEIYLNQTNGYKSISLNYASPWNFTYSMEMAYDNLKWLAIAFTVLILAIYMMLLLAHNKQYSNQYLIELAFLFSYTCVLLLPSMHDRYGYPYVILGIALFMFNSRFIPLFIGIAIVDLRMYSIFLFGAPPIEELFVIINIICYMVFSICIIRDGIRDIQ